MFIVRQTATQADEAPVMQFAVVGSTGNLYETTIGKVPSCSCPDSKKGNQCKHIIYGACCHLRAGQVFLSSRVLLADGPSSSVPSPQGAGTFAVSAGVSVLCEWRRQRRQQQRS